MSPALSKRIATTIFVGAVVIPFSTGCDPGPTTGGDTPVTAARLAGSRLIDIKRPVSWEFSDSIVIIENQGRPLPSDAVHASFDSSPYSQIEAQWQLDEITDALLLDQIKTDGNSLDGRVSVPISPAGHVRINLGGRQYNVHRAQSTAP